MSARSVFLDLIRRVEVLTLVVIIVIGGALWAFVALAAEMLEGDLHSFDKAVLLALRVPGDLSDPIGGPQVEVAMRDLTALGGVTVLTLITLCVLVFLVSPARLGPVHGCGDPRRAGAVASGETGLFAAPT
jgi:undecaprenyl-diphosphatase